MGSRIINARTCGRQFVLDAASRVIAEEQRSSGGTLTLREDLPAWICRAVGVSLRWLMRFIVTCFAALPDHLHVQPVAAPRDVLLGRLEVEADEMWSFVTEESQQAMGLDRHGQADPPNHCVPRGRSQSRECETAVGQSSCGLPRAGDVLIRTNMPSTQGSFRQRNTKPSRSTPGKPITSSASITRYGSASPVWCVTPSSFSKKLANHIGAIKYFICHYNLTRAAALPV